eukprot:tig00021589_g22718.t1
MEPGASDELSALERQRQQLHDHEISLLRTELYAQSAQATKLMSELGDARRNIRHLEERVARPSAGAPPVAEAPLQPRVRIPEPALSRERELGRSFVQPRDLDLSRDRSLLTDRLTRENAELTAQVESLKRELERVRAAELRLRSDEQQCLQLQEDVELLRDALTTARTDALAYEKDILQLRSENRILRTQLAQREGRDAEESHRARNEVVSLEQRLADAHAALREERERAASLEEQLAAKEERSASLGAALRSEEALVARCTAQLEAAREQAAAASGAAREAEERGRELRSALRASERALEERDADARGLARESESLRRALAAAEEEARQWREAAERAEERLRGQTGEAERVRGAALQLAGGFQELRERYSAMLRESARREAESSSLRRRLLSIVRDGDAPGTRPAHPEAEALLEKLEGFRGSASPPRAQGTLEDPRVLELERGVERLLAALGENDTSALRADEQLVASARALRRPSTPDRLARPRGEGREVGGSPRRALPSPPLRRYGRDSLLDSEPRRRRPLSAPPPPRRGPAEEGHETDGELDAARASDRDIAIDNPARPRSAHRSSGRAPAAAPAAPTPPPLLAFSIATPSWAAANPPPPPPTLLRPEARVVGPMAPPTPKYPNREEMEPADPLPSPPRHPDSLPPLPRSPNTGPVAEAAPAPRPSPPSRPASGPLAAASPPRPSSSLQAGAGPSSPRPRPTPRAASPARGGDAAGLLAPLHRGDVLTKFSFNSRGRSRRFVVLEGSALRWGDPKTRRLTSTADMREALRIDFGPRGSAAFKARDSVRDAPWLCFSVVFPHRTLDLAASNEAQMIAWFLALQLFVEGRTSHVPLGRPQLVSCIATMKAPSGVAAAPHTSPRRSSSARRQRVIDDSFPRY